MNAEITKDSVIEVLSRHIGVGNGIHASELVGRITGLYEDATLQRQLRTVIEELRREGNHVCGTPRTGYYLAANADELDRTCSFLYVRALTTLSQIAAMKRVSLPDLRGQLHLPT